MNLIKTTFTILSILNAFTGISSRSQLSFKETYVLDESSLMKGRRPEYYLTQDQKGFKKSKRDSQAEFTINSKTDSFRIYLSCQKSDVSMEQCEMTLNRLVRAAKRIEGVVHLKEPVLFNATFKPFCESTDKKCDSSSILGMASPNAWYVFEETPESLSFVDPSYAYPSSLVRQWVTNLDSNGPDINAAFNSNFNWWFAGAENSDYVGMIQSGIFGPVDSSPNSTLKSYDFEQVATHEMIHGLGFVSGWNPYTWTTNLYLPGFPIYNETDGSILKLSRSLIFDRSLSDAVNGFWLKDYAAIIRRDINLSKQLANASSNWLSIFEELDGGRIAASLGSSGGPFVTLRGIWSWYNVLESGAVLSRYAILYTPEQFDLGSSGSHLDDKFYSSTSQFLLKPYASKGAGLDGTVPLNALGPVAESILGILRSMGYSTVLLP